MADFVEPAEGQYYARMFRPALNENPHRVVDEGALVQTGVVLQMLTSDLRELFEIVEPTGKNLDTFGHRIRHQLIVACTEVEAAWRAILKANGRQPANGKFFTTKDYILLADPLHLREYKVGLGNYRDFGEFEPFASWDSTDPTKSLPWYSDYNGTKHDREENLHLATLRNLVHAVAGYYVLAVVQFNGPYFEFGSGQFQQGVFWLPFTPNLLVDNYKVPPSGIWQRVDYPF